MRDMEQVYQAYFLDVYRYALRLCGERALAEDITSDCFLRAMDRMHTYRGEGELRVWLCSIARNLYLSHLRRQARVMLPGDLSTLPVLDDPAECVTTQDAGERAAQAVSALEEPARQIFRLRALQGLSFRDIAALYDKSENWACVVYHRARKKLMKALEEQDETHL